MNCSGGQAGNWIQSLPALPFTLPNSCSASMIATFEKGLHATLCACHWITEAAFDQFNLKYTKVRSFESCDLMPFSLPGISMLSHPLKQMLFARHLFDSFPYLLFLLQVAGINCPLFADWKAILASQTTFIPQIEGLFRIMCPCSFCHYSLGNIADIVQRDM